MKRLHKEEKGNILLFIGCWLMYAVTTFTKSQYTASVAYIVSRGIFDKASAGAIASAFYLFYGVGQALGGRFVDRFSPYKLMTIGAVCATVANLILCFTNNYGVVMVVWSLAGISQFGIWPGVCRVISTDIFPEFRQKANVYLQYGLPLGTLISYILSSTLLERFGWSSMFICSTVMLLGTLIFWYFVAVKNIPSERVPANTQKADSKAENINSFRNSKSFMNVLFSGGAIFLLFIALSTSMLSNGALVWTPTMIMESYSISSAFASIQNVILVVVQIVGLMIVSPILRRIKDPVIGEMLMFSLCFIPLITLQFIGKIPFGLAVVMLSAMTMLMRMRSVFSMQITMRFAKYGYSGTYSGISNCLSSFGIVLASSGYGLIAEKLGWSAVSVTWLIFAIISVLCCIPAFYMWNRMEKKEELKKNELVKVSV